MKIKLNDKVLLLSKDESYVVSVSKKIFNGRSGMINLSRLIGKNYGSKIKTHLGKEFVIVKPSVLDLFEKCLTRTAQVILPKDASLILGYTGISSDSLVVDIGTGSAYLAIFLANYLSKGKVITYEKDKRFIKIAGENIKLSGLKNIQMKQKDVSGGISERNVDLITLDLQHPEKLIKHAYKSLKTGGWLVVYSPTIEEVIKVTKEIRKRGFSEVKTIENIVREWQTERTTRPKSMGLIHTGWLTFARKLE
ncbi:MAG: tRNA (adenine-N1)-methyltransferase [Candidatus Aenigmatarchaeota archaeon]